MYRTRRMRNRRSGRSKRGGESHEKKGIKIALGITPETRMVTDEERKTFKKKLLNPTIMGEILTTWDSLLDDSVYDDDGNRKTGNDKLYVLSPRQQELANEFMKSSAWDRTFKTGHADRQTFYRTLITDLRTPDYLGNLTTKIESDTDQFKEISVAQRAYDSAMTNSTDTAAQVDQHQSSRRSVVVPKTAQNVQSAIRETNYVDGVGSDAVSPKDAYKGMGASAKSAKSAWDEQVDNTKFVPLEVFNRIRREKAQAQAKPPPAVAVAAEAAAAAAAAEAAAAAAAAAAEAAAAEAAALAQAKPPTPVVVSAAAQVEPPPNGGKSSRRRHHRRRSNNKSRKVRKSRKSRKSRRGHRVRHGGRRI